MDIESPLNALLGRLIIGFQDVEAELDGLIVLMVDADSEAVEILISELEYGARVKTTDVLFARFIDVRKIDDADGAKAAFHRLMTRCNHLGEMRNAFAHSSYAHLVDHKGTPIALVRKNSRLRAGKGVREVQEDDLTAEAFEPHFAEMREVLTGLSAFRQRIIDWQ